MPVSCIRFTFHGVSWWEWVRTISGLYYSMMIVEKFCPPHFTCTFRNRDDLTAISCVYPTNMNDKSIKMLRRVKFNWFINTEREIPSIKDNSIKFVSGWWIEAEVVSNEIINDCYLFPLKPPDGRKEGGVKEYWAKWNYFAGRKSLLGKFLNILSPTV